jgi:hypothetical protein
VRCLTHHLQLSRGSLACGYSEIGLPTEVYPPKETLIPSSLFGSRVGAMLKTTLRGLGADQGLMETMAKSLTKVRGCGIDDSVVFAG